MFWRHMLTASSGWECASSNKDACIKPVSSGEAISGTPIGDCDAPQTTITETFAQENNMANHYMGYRVQLLLPGPTQTASSKTSTSPGKTDSPEQPEGSSSQNGLSTGAKAAIGVTIPIVVIIVLVFFLFVRRRRKQKGGAKFDQHDNAPGAMEKPDLDDTTHLGPSQDAHIGQIEEHRAELNPAAALVEVSGQSRWQELAAGQSQEHRAELNPSAALVEAPGQPAATQPQELGSRPLQELSSGQLHERRAELNPSAGFVELSSQQNSPQPLELETNPPSSVSKSISPAANPQSAPVPASGGGWQWTQPSSQASETSPQPLVQGITGDPHSLPASTVPVVLEEPTHTAGLVSGGGSNQTLEQLRTERARLEAEIARQMELERLNREREEINRRITEMESRNH
ncbi:hypothetical protein FQN51_004409 [Onygenales sp. PD_10]|nr:hypothetical protein FQN51_004409 [Onygenales sp. PD_10]